MANNYKCALWYYKYGCWYLEDRICIIVIWRCKCHTFAHVKHNYRYVSKLEYAICWICKTLMDMDNISHLEKVRIMHSMSLKSSSHPPKFNLQPHVGYLQYKVFHWVITAVNITIKWYDPCFFSQMMECRLRRNITHMSKDSRNSTNWPLLLRQPSDIYPMWTIPGKEMLAVIDQVRLEDVQSEHQRCEVLRWASGGITPW